MKKLKIILIAVFIILLLAVLGEYIPRKVFSNTKQEANDSGKIFTQYAYHEAERIATAQKKDWLITGIKIKQVTEQAGDRKDPICMDYPILLRGQYSAEIVIYSVFGLPYGTVTVNCEGTNFKRSF